MWWSIWTSFTSGRSRVAKSEQAEASSGKNFAAAEDTDKNDSQGVPWELIIYETLGKTGLKCPVDGKEHAARGDPFK